MNQEKEFKVGDIVEHISGRIGNGRYGEIILDPWNELSVLDNEGGLDMSVTYHKDELTVVGNTTDNPELLEIFV